MPPELALLLTIAGIVYMLRLDFLRHRDVTFALWIPLLWMLIIGSRLASSWLNIGITVRHPDDLLEGSPLDVAIFLALILLGLGTLFRRRLPLQRFVANNTALCAFLLY